MKKLIRERVVPTISASVSWLIFGRTVSGRPSLPKFRQQQKDPGQPALAGVEELGVAHSGVTRRGPAPLDPSG